MAEITVQETNPASVSDKYELAVQSRDPKAMLEVAQSALGTPVADIAINAANNMYKSKAEGYGRIKFLSLWSDNCGDQFKSKYHFGWASGSLDNEGLLAIFSTTSHRAMAKVFVIVREVCPNMQLP